MSELQTVPKKVGSNFLTFGQAAKEEFSGRASAFAVRRWHVVGLGNPPVKLEAVRIGGRYFVAREACREFLVATSDPSLFLRKKVTERCEKAKKRLQKAGA